MKTVVQIDLTFEQILAIIRQLSKQEKRRLSKELEKEVVDSHLSRLLNKFKTDDLDEKTISEEVESVREELYGKQKH